MKRFFITIVAMVMCTIGYSFEVKNSDGVIISYCYRGNMQEVEVTSGNNTKYTGSVVIPKEVTYNDKKLKVTGIAANAFKDCYDLTSVSIPEGITNIGDYAFYHCGKLISAPIPNSVTTIGREAFSKCNALVSFVIPNSLTRIGKRAFSDCSSLKTVAFPNGVEDIEEMAFADCKALSSVVISKSLTRIGKRAFSDCSSLKTVALPNSVKDIEDMAFFGCSSLTFITIGGDVQIIDNKAFANCPAVRDVYCYAENVPSTDSDAFDNIGYATLYVPEASVDAYKAVEPWRNFKAVVALCRQETSIRSTFADGPEEAASYTIAGQRVSQHTKGLTIVKKSDHTTKKVFVK